MRALGISGSRPPRPQPQNLKELTGGEFRVFRDSVRLL